MLAKSETPRSAAMQQADSISMVVDLAALRRNYATLQKMIGSDIYIIPSIKGDGYGIGAAEAAAEFAAVGAYSVATGSIDDALAIRHSGNDMRIHMFPGALPGAMPLYYEQRLTPSIYNDELAAAASAAAKSKWGVFIKVDAGFGRLGVPIDEAKDFILKTAALPNLFIEGVFTHLPFGGDEAGREWAAQATKKFDALLEGLEKAGLNTPITQCVASTGTLHGIQKRTRCNAVSVGHLLFGGLGREPLGAEKTSDLVPAITRVSARLIHIRRHKQAGTIGGGGKISVAAGTVTGTLPIGLHEGYRAAVAGKTSCVLVHGRRAPVYFVSQEYMAVDLTKVPNVQIGDEVCLFGKDHGEHISIEEVANWQGQAPLHIVMNMNKRFPIRFIDSAK
jgi:alanine racemase